MILKISSFSNKIFNFTAEKKISFNAYFMGKFSNIKAPDRMFTSVGQVQINL